MKRNGFTLIELLAVIVILAIIALIAIPIVLNIVDDAIEKSEQRSVELYASAVKNAIAAYRLNNTVAPENFSDLTIEYDGDVQCDIQKLYPDKTIYLGECTVNGGEKEYSYGKIQTACTLDDKDVNSKYSVGDVVSCELSNSIEKFYVIENEDEDTTEGIDLLAEFNLTIPEDLKTEYPVQSETTAGGTEFSTSSYWMNENYEFLPQYAQSFYVYDNNSSVYKYVEAYKKMLISNGLNVTKARLLSESEGRNIIDNYQAPSWINLKNFWYGSLSEGPLDLSGNTIINMVDIMGIGSTSFFAKSYVRPVITISTSNIK